MNWLGLVTLVLGFVAYGVGLYCTERSMTPRMGRLAGSASFLLATPAFIYAGYYSGLFGEPIWLYRVRAVPGSELLASLAGLLAGWTQGRLVPRLRLSPLGKRTLLPVVLGFTLALPYLKPVLRPLDPGALREEWKGDGCLQSTLSTCGPASAATIVRRLGGHLSEPDLARESFTCASGTEIWYLARALRRHGFGTGFLFSDLSSSPVPAIAGVRLRHLGNSGHFVALLERQGSHFVIADPMEGLSTNTVSELNGSYEFTGFFMSIGRGDASR